MRGPAPCGAGFSPLKVFAFNKVGAARPPGGPRDQPDGARSGVAERRLALALAAYVLVLGALAIWRWHIWTYGADTGLFTQAVSDTFGGLRDGPEEGTHFRFHWAPILATLWPLVAATHAPLTLQFAQIVLVGGSAIPLFAFARGYLGARIAGAVAVLLLLYPPLLAVAFTEFHEIAFYPAIYFALCWAADRARWRIFAVLALASTGVREDTCIVFALTGLGFVALGLLGRRRALFRLPAGRVAELGKPGEPGGRDEAEALGGPRGLLANEPLQPARLAFAGFGLTALNAAALAIYYGVVTPRLGGWEPAAIFYTYPFAAGPTAVALGIVRNPANLRYLWTFGRFTYLLEAFAPLAFLPLFSRWALLALPGFAIVLLSSNAIAWRMGSHYAAIWIPGLFIALVAVLARWSERGFVRRAHLALRAATAICALVLIAFDPLHPAHYLRVLYPVDGDVRRALATIPPDAFVALHDEWYTHVAATRPHATVFFCPYVDYLVYADDYPGDFYRTQIVPEIAAEIAHGQAHLLHRFGKVRVYARTPDAGARYGRCITARPEGFATLRAFLNYDLERERAGEPRRRGG